MSHALELATAHASSAEKAAGCVLDCHVVGERGLNDGGFLDVAQALAFRVPPALSYSALPHALQRLGGVRCTSCHGPGAISAPEGRARILRADVCATCHDAPPRYTHVTDWARSSMAHADATPRAREKPCARCHTTGGFLDAIGARVRSDLSRDDADVDVGIACAACHAAHGPNEGHGLIRTLPTAVAAPADSAAENPASALCASCHAPAQDEPLPAASSAALWLGRVRLPTSLGGDELRGAAPHASIVGGCVGCHGHATSSTRRGTDHSFAVEPQTCDACHAGDSAQRRAADGHKVVVEARSLLRVLARRCGSELPESLDAPVHAHPSELTCAGEPALARALYLALLVAEDGAAGVHNGPFARALLSEATRLSLVH